MARGVDVAGRHVARCVADSTAEVTSHGEGSAGLVHLNAALHLCSRLSYSLFPFKGFAQTDISLLPAFNHMFSDPKGEIML